VPSPNLKSGKTGLSFYGRGGSTETTCVTMNNMQQPI